MMQTQVPEGLQGLILLNKSMQTGQAQPVTQDGRPTIAGQLAQAAQQQMAPQPSQGGAPGMPGMQQAAQGAAQGAQVQMLNQQREQQQMQEVLKRLAQAQQQPQAAQQGIAQMAPDMGFADGGIVGYAGDDESVVGPGLQPSGERLPPGGIVPRNRRLSEEIFEKITGSRLNTAPLSQEEQTARAIAATEADEEYLRKRGLPTNLYEMQEKMLADRAAREERRRAEYEGRKEDRWLDNLAAALSSAAVADRRYVGAALGAGFAGQRSANAEADAREAERREKLDAELENARISLMSGRVKEAKETRAKALSDYERDRAAENEQTKFQAEIRKSLYGPTVQAETTEREGRLNREAEAERARLARLSSEKIAAMRQRGFTEEVLAEYLRLQKIDPAKAEEYLQAVQKVQGASRADSLAVTAQAKANEALEKFKKSPDYILKMGKPAEQAAALRAKQAELMQQYPGAVFDTSSASGKGPDLSQWGELKVNKP